MDNETYEQLPLNRELVEDAMQYVKENTSVDVKFFKGTGFLRRSSEFCRTGHYPDRSRH